jgi:hypothetical protein
MLCGVASVTFNMNVHLIRDSNDVTLADGEWRVLFALVAHQPADAEFFRSATLPAHAQHDFRG